MRLHGFIIWCPLPETLPPPETGDSADSWRDRRRRRILEAAAIQFAGQSYYHVTMDSVAVAADMGKATLYRYFPSKEDLYVAVFETALSNLSELLEAEIAIGGATADVLTRLIRVLVPQLWDHLRGLKAFDGGEVQLAERKRRLFRERRRALTQQIEQVLSEGVKKGEVRALDCHRTAELIIGMTWSSAMTAPANQSLPLADLIADVFLRGVLALDQIH